MYTPDWLFYCETKIEKLIADWLIKINTKRRKKERDWLNLFSKFIQGVSSSVQLFRFA